MALMKCEECGNDVSTSALACPKCGAPPAGAGAAPPTQSIPGEGLGYVILLLPLGATILIWLWVGSMNMLQDPATSLAMVGMATILCTAVLVAVEAGQLGMGKAAVENGKKGNGPIAWFLAVLAFWVGAFPLYLSKRKWYGKRSLAVGGLLVVLVFLGSWAAMAASIDSQKASVRHQLQGLGIP